MLFNLNDVVDQEFVTGQEKLKHSGDFLFLIFLTRQGHRHHLSKLLKSVKQCTSLLCLMLRVFVHLSQSLSHFIMKLSMRFVSIF